MTLKEQAFLSMNFVEIERYAHLIEDVQMRTFALRLIEHIEEWVDERKDALRTEFRHQHDDECDRLMAQIEDLEDEVGRLTERVDELQSQLAEAEA